METVPILILVEILQSLLCISVVGQHYGYLITQKDPSVTE